MFGTGELIDELTRHILETDDPQDLEKARITGYFLLQSALSQRNPKPPQYWKKEWKNSIHSSNIPALNKVIESLPNVPMPILVIFDLLKHSNFHIIDKKQESSAVRKVFKINPTLPEPEVVSIVLSVFRGTSDESLLYNKSISFSDHTLIQKIIKIIRSMRLIENTANSFTGQIGHSMRFIIDREYHQFLASAWKP